MRERARARIGGGGGGGGGDIPPRGVRPREGYIARGVRVAPGRGPVPGPPPGAMKRCGHGKPHRKRAFSHTEHDSRVCSELGPPGSLGRSRARQRCRGGGLFSPILADPRRFSTILEDSRRFSAASGVGPAAGRRPLPETALPLHTHTPAPDRRGPSPKTRGVSYATVACLLSRVSYAT